MQVAMKNKKKQAIYIAIIVISLGVSGWLVYGSLDIGGGGLDVLQDNDLDADSLSAGNTTFPYGTSLDFSIFSDAKFLELTEQPRLNVTEQELGKINAFVP